MVKRVLQTAIVAGALSFAPIVAAQAGTVCSTGTLVVCVGFTFGNTGFNTYSLRVDFQSSTAGGSLYQFGIDGASGFALTSTGSILVNGAPNVLWGFDCSGLPGLDVCAAGPTGGGGLHVGDFATFNFHSDASFAGNFDALTEQAHFQAFTGFNCSVKVSTSPTDFPTAGTGGGSTSNTTNECGPTTTTPEPASFFLLGSGLVGLGGLARRRRRTA